VNWLDILILILVLGSVVTSISKGFSREIIGLTAAIAGFFLGIWFYGPAGAFLLPYVSSKGVANFCGFVIVFIGVLLIGAIIGIVLKNVLKAAGLSWFDRLLGAGFGLVRGLLLSIALVLAIVAFAPGLQGDSPPRSVVESRLAPYVIDAARLFSAVAPRELKDGFRKRYHQVKDAWRKAVNTRIRDLRSAEI
jgi:membrane protein required for colicin V production